MLPVPVEDVEFAVDSLPWLFSVLSEGPDRLWLIFNHIEPFQTAIWKAGRQVIDFSQPLLFHERHIVDDILVD